MKKTFGLEVDDPTDADDAAPVVSPLPRLLVPAFPSYRAPISSETCSGIHAVRTKAFEYSGTVVCTMLVLCFDESKTVLRKECSAQGYRHRLGR